MTRRSIVQGFPGCNVPKLISLFACRAYGPERERSPGKCCPQRAAIAWIRSSWHPYPPVFPQGMPDQLSNTLLLRPCSVKAILTLQTARTRRQGRRASM